MPEELQNSQPVTQNPTPSQKNSLLDWKILSLPLIVLIISLAFVGYYLVKGDTSDESSKDPAPVAKKESTKSATPKSTKQNTPSDWKTYSNSTTGIQIDYPSSISYSEPKVEGDLGTAALVPPGGTLKGVFFSFLADGNETLSILSSINYTKTAAGGFAKLYSETLKSVSVAKMEITKIQIGGVSAYKATFKVDDPLTVQIIYIDTADLKSAHTITLSFSESNKETVERMLSSFKFLR